MHGAQGDAMNHTYAHNFPGGLRCEFTLTFEGTEMNWSPDRPPQSWPHWRTYYRWRTRCLADYAIKTGVTLIVRIDVPWIGIRGFDTIFRDRETAYEYHRVQRECLLNAKEKIESHPGVHAQVLAGIEQTMVEVAPRSAGGAA
jgi:hypothetical protein